MAFYPKDLCWSVLVPITIIALLVVWILLKSFLPKPKVTDFHKKYVLITGCDTGFGKTIAIRLDQMGFHVIAACLTDEGKKNVQAVCSDRLLAVRMDVTDSKQIQEVYEQVKIAIPPDAGLWAVVNNAGYMTLGPLEWFKIEEYKRMADVNLWGLIDVTKTFLPLVKKAKGRIVNFSSVAGLNSYFGFAPYCVTKYGVEAFSDALRREMVHFGVKVCILEPQAFKTTLWTETAGAKMTSLWNGISDEMKAEYGEKYLTNCRKHFVVQEEKLASSNTDLVVNGAIDAVTSRDPATRSLIGPIAKIYLVIAKLPTSLQDFVLKPRIADLSPRSSVSQ